MIGSDDMITEKNKKFLEYYIIENHGGKAYKRVYENVSDSSAAECASRLLAKPEIQLELKKLQEERMERIMWSTEDVLKEIKEIAYSESASKAEKLKALELAAKSLGMFRDKVEHSGGISITLGKEIEEWAE